MGSGMPNGKMVFVMRKKSLDEGSFELWDPATGQCYFFNNVEEPNRILGIKFGTNSHLQIRPTDPVSPLTQIHTIISSSNVYVNIQNSDYPICMDFKLSNKNNWRRFFEVDTPQITCQPLIIYSDPK